MMKLMIATVCLTLLTGSLCLAQVPLGARETGGKQTVASLVADGSNAFAAELYAKLAEKQGNLFFSPSSIDAALAMTYAGAAGNTADQMAKTMHFTLPPDKLTPAFAQLLSSLKPMNGEPNKPAFQLVVANALWGQKGFAFKPAFTGLLKESYGAGLSEVDFAKTEEARKTINDWVADKTKDKIKDLIGKGNITDATRLVLTNAIYFKSNWSEKFTKEATKDGPFNVSAGAPMTVPMMHIQHQFGYMENDDLQLLDLPYVFHELSMVILLPKKADGLANVEKSLSADNIEKWLKARENATVKVAMPKFTFSSDFMLGSELKALGMTDAFDARKADFSGITSEQKLAISEVIHKAFVAVDEEGTEAAAATAVMMVGAAFRQPQEPKVFTADHPFIFLIRHTGTGEILFMGRLANPKGSEEVSPVNQKKTGTTVDPDKTLFQGK